MPKLLRAVRLDESDEQVFRACGAARDGEPVITGGFAVCDFENAPRCEPACHCQASFLALTSRARCTIAEVVEVSDEQMAEEVEALAWHLVKSWNAPSWEAAHALAEEEVRHAADVCETLSPGVWITVTRERRAEDGALEEQYAVYDRLLLGSHPA
jgi:hypothetical protein